MVGASIQQKVYVILWKSFILRKRSLILSVLECLCPLLILYCIHIFVTPQPQHVKREKQFNFNPPGIFSIADGKSLPSSSVFAYTPSNQNTDRLVKEINLTAVHREKNDYGESFKGKRLAIKPFDSEDQLKMWLLEEINRTPGGIPIGIVFLHMNFNTRILKYKIKYDVNMIRDDSVSLVVKEIQMRVDHTFLGIAGVHVKHAYIGQMPEFDLMIMNKGFLGPASTMYILVCFGYGFYVQALTRNAILEKETGMKEISRIAGMAACMWWGQWLVHSLALQLPVAAIVVLVALAPVLPDGTRPVAVLLMVLFVMNLTALVFAASCLFSGGAKGTTFVLFAWIVLHFASWYFVAVDPGSAPGPWTEALLSLLLPSFNLVTAYKIMMCFRTFGSEWSSGLLFRVGAPSSHLSVGGSVGIFVASLGLYALLIVVLDAVHPGPYGIAVTFGSLRARLRRLHGDGDGGNAPEPLPNSYEAPPKGAKVGVEIRRLRKTFGGCRPAVAVQHVDLDVYEGEIMALLGHNGAGKTTTMSMITGMFSPSGGTIRVAGASPLRCSLGFCPQHNVYFPKLTVIEHLAFFAMLKGFSRAQAKAYGADILSTLGLADKKDAVAGMLSGGMKRRLCLAIALAGDPAVLVLDEPTSGLDPENRRIIWDIMLGMRGSRTILITTHFMEEADVLGDRIAIMDAGQVVCCGTPMFLKRIYGTGYQVHLLKNKNVPAKGLERFVNQNINRERVAIKTISPTEVYFVIRETDVDSFPALFHALEAAKTELGVKGVSVTCSTIEDVFLNVANQTMFLEETPGGRKLAKPSVGSTLSNRSIEIPLNRLCGRKLFVQRFLTLICKRFIYLRRDCMSFVVKILLAGFFISTLAYLMDPRDVNPRPIRLNPSAHPGSVILIARDAGGEETSHVAAEHVKRQKVAVELVPMGKPLLNHCLELARENYGAYYTKYVYGLSFFGVNSTVLYMGWGESQDAVAANLLSNILLQSHSGSGLIETTSDPYGKHDYDCYGFQDNFCFFCMAVVTLGLMLLMTEFVPFVLDERSSGFKHQQYLAGVSPTLYWTSNLLADMLIYLLVVAFFLLLFVATAPFTFPLDSGWTWALAGVLALHGISALCFTYLFCFLFRRTTAGVSVYLTLNLATGLVAAFAMSKWFAHLEDNIDPRGFWGSALLFAFSLNPTFCAAMSVYYIVKAAGMARVSRTPGCDKNNIRIWDLDIVRMPTESRSSVILHHLIALSLLWVVYLATTLVVDYGLPRRLLTIARRERRSSDESEEDDEDVREERERVRALREAEAGVATLHVEGLAKKFWRGPRAVSDVTFAVGRGECFGLLGVNGAGKTTTFRMITGETTAGAGDAVILGDSVVRHRRRYMRKVGYCPQFDAALGCLTGRETLWTVARLRGVPPKEVRAQVDQWLSEVGLEEHADKKARACSGGTRRKLCTAMAFAGEPAVVLLDEPTTGVDPAARRHLWTALQERKRTGQSIVLTSHSMEECEALCDRLTILVAGRMVCIGSSEHLKTKFSQGYNVLVKIKGDASDKERDAIKRSFERQFPRSELKDEHRTLLTYQMIDPAIPLSQLFSDLLKMKKDRQSAVEDFSVSNTTLEQLFLSLAQSREK